MTTPFADLPGDAMMTPSADLPCPCGQGPTFASCCGRWKPFHPAPDAEHLMRSRYSAYVRVDGDYLLATWHPDTRPVHFDLAAEQPPTEWLGLTVIRHEAFDARHAVVEFVAHYRIRGREHRLHEISRFECMDGHWLYRDGVTD